MFQSVVLLSKLPFIQLFTHLAGIMAPEYFDSGEPCLEAGQFLIMALNLKICVNKQNIYIYASGSIYAIIKCRCIT